MLDLQERLEKDFSNTNSKAFLRKALSPETVAPMVQAIRDYLYLDHDYEYEVDGVHKIRKDLIEIHDWLGKADIEELMWDMFTVLLSTHRATVQALVGAVFNKVNIDSEHRKMMAIEVLLQGFNESPLIQYEITKGEHCMFSLVIELPNEITEPMDDFGYPLPCVIPPTVTNNREIGYLSFKKSIISGGALKHHDMYVNLHAINRQNAVGFSIEPRFTELYDFVFDDTPQFKKGVLEDALAVAKRFGTFNTLKVTMPVRMGIMLDNGNEFYFAHKYDNRRRLYVQGFELNYQSHKFIRASVQFHKHEIVTPEF